MPLTVHQILLLAYWSGLVSWNNYKGKDLMILHVWDTNLCLRPYICRSILFSVHTFMIFVLFFLFCFFALFSTDLIPLEISNDYSKKMWFFMLEYIRTCEERGMKQIEVIEFIFSLRYFPLYHILQRKGKRGSTRM